MNKDEVFDLMIDNSLGGDKASYRNAAKVAIEAMREPTEEMIKVGTGQVFIDDSVQSLYQAMIDAALKE